MNPKQETDSISDVLGKMKLVYSPKFGLANALSVSEMEHTTIRKVGNGTYVLANVIPMFRTTVMNRKKDAWTGSGAALSKDKSQVKAFGEFIERFCASNTENDHIIPLRYGTYEEQCKKGPCLNPRELIDFDDSAYKNEKMPFHRYQEKSIVSWVKGTEITHNKSVWVPAQKVFLGIPLNNGELPYMQWLSTGLACGSSYNSALISGILEVVERDSFMLTWLLRLPGRRIVVDSAKNLELMNLYKHITNCLVGGDSLHMFDISRTRGIYTVLTFIKNDNPNSFGLITSAAADIDPERALHKSLQELCLTQAYAYLRLYESEETRQRVNTMKETDVLSLDDHLFFYGSGNRSNGFDFIDSNTNNTNVNLSDMRSYLDSKNEEDRFSYIVDLFRQQGVLVYSVDVTRQEILDCDLRVVRAIIPGYNDLNVLHSIKPLANKRLLKYKEMNNRTINDAPHPFP